MECYCCFCVSTGTVGVVERFGEFSYIAEPGLMCYNPCINAVVGRQNLRVMRLPVVVPTKTLDNVAVTMKLDIMYKVVSEKVKEAFYNFSDPPRQISSFVTNVVRGQVPSHSLDDLFLLRDELQDGLKKDLDVVLDKYGFVLIAALISDVNPAASVREAMNMINTNARLKVSQEHKAVADKIAIVAAAEAHAEAKRLSGVGIAEQRKAVINGLRTSMTTFREKVPTMSSKDIMSVLLVNQYFDCMKDVAESKGGAQTIFTSSADKSTVESFMAAQSGVTAKHR